MRTCPKCGTRNPADRDFCTCGEYIRWEPTGFMPAITPPAEEAPPAQPAEPPAEEAPRAQPAEGGAPPGADTQTAHAPPPPQAPPSAHQTYHPQPQAAPPPTPPPPQPAAAPPPAAPLAPPARAAAAIALRIPHDERRAAAGELGVAIVPGERARLLALVRNQSEIVDNYDVVVHGIPREWWTAMPETVYLIPFGSGGGYEQEIEIVLHPPRAPGSHAGRHELQIAVLSRAQGAEVAAGPFTLGILPFEQYAISLRPQRATGRRRASYTVSVTNSANASIALALDAADDDGECRFTFGSVAIEAPAAGTAATRLQVQPPKQIWIGRALDRRFAIASASGEEGEKLLAGKDDGEQGGRAGRPGKLPKIPGISPPKVSAPKVSVGPGGVNVGGPQVRAPKAKAVNLIRPTLGLKALRAPDRGGAPAAPAAPLAPTQAVFRQKPWLPWWLSIVAPLVALLALALFLLLPRTIEVPDVVGSPTVFAAENELMAAGLQLKERENRRTTKAKPGTVLAQSPEAGASVKKGSPVSLEIAVSNGDAIVPRLAGLTLPEADKALRAEKLQKGTLSVQPPDPKLKIASTIPAAGETVKEGTPIDIFYPDPNAPAGGKQAGGAGAGGGTGAKDIAVPAIEPTDQQGYGAVLAKAGLVPGDPQRRINDAPRGTVFATDPAVGTKVAKGAGVTMLVSAGFPRIAFDNEQNVLLADGATGKRISPAVAKSPTVDEKDPSWSADGASIVYTAGGQLFSADMVQRGRAPAPLRPAAEQYADPSFAPIATRSVLAVARIDGEDRDLCFGRVKVDSYTPQCIGDDRFSVSFAHWSADGKTILVPATQPDKRFGIVQYTSKRAFSALKADWGKGEFVTQRAVGKGVLDAALSPDGKRLAAISNLDTSVPQLYLTTPDDIALKKAKPLPIGACKVVWLDSGILALVKLGEACNQAVGEIVRINVDDPTTTAPLATAGDNPTFQPLSVATGG